MVDRKKKKKKKKKKKTRISMQKNLYKKTRISMQSFSNFFPIFNIYLKFVSQRPIKALKKKIEGREMTQIAQCDTILIYIYIQRRANSLQEICIRMATKRDTQGISISNPRPSGETKG